MSKVNLSPVTNLQNEVAATTTINNNSTLITQAIENTISRDGTLPNMMNSQLDMNSNKIVNLPDAFTDQEPVTYGQFVDGITSVNNGVVVDGAFIMTEHNDTAINDRVLTAGLNMNVTDFGPKGNVTVSLDDPELNALALVTSDEDKLPYFTGSGTADVTDFTPFARTLLDDEDASTMRDTLGVTIGTDTQPHSDLLDSLNDSGTGLISKTDVDVITPRTIIAPASGITVTDGDGVAGNPTLALSNDLEALEELSTTGLITRTATDTATTRTITGTNNEVTVTNGDGISGNPTVSLPSALTFTGKTVAGGTFSSPVVNTPTGITKADVGLSDVDNTSDATKNAAVATLTNKTLTSPVINSPTGIVKGDVGLGNVDNTSDATKNSATATLTHKTINGPDNTITNISNASLASSADSTIKSNISGSSASPSDNTITAVLDKQFGTSQGTVIYRGASAWSALTPGTSGNFLQTNGASANPSWNAIPGGGDMLSTNNLSDVSDPGTSLFNLGANFGQCRMTLVSTNLVLAPYQGNLLTINSKAEVIPDAGVSLSPTGLSSSTFYYIYAYMNSGTMTLEASTTAHAAQSGTGVRIKSGDATRTLVGAAYTNTGPAWADTNGKLYTLSYFNRRDKKSILILASSLGLSSDTMTELTTTLNTKFISWGDELTRSTVLVSANADTTNRQIAQAIGVDSTSTPYSVDMIIPNYSTSMFGSGNIEENITGLTENALHYATFLARAVGGGFNASWIGGRNAFTVVTRG